MFFRLLQTKLDSAHNRELQLVDPHGNQPMAFIYHPARGYFLHSYRNNHLESSDICEQPLNVPVLT